MPSISCFYTHYNTDPINFIFVKYENFIKIFLNEKSIIMSIQHLISNHELFKIYLISLLLTEDTSKISIDIENYRNKYGVSTISYWKNISLTSEYNIIFLEKSPHKNPLNSVEPKRSTSFKKINKFMRKFNKYYDEEYIASFGDILNEYYSLNTIDIIYYIRGIRQLVEYEKKIEILSAIKHNYGWDIYSNIIKFM